jgi:hypothetical protein
MYLDNIRYIDDIVSDSLDLIRCKVLDDIVLV